jgi:hypothetical protein
VAAQILFDRGSIRTGGGGPEWRIPKSGGSESTLETRVVPEHVLIQIDGLDQLEVVIERFGADNGDPETERLVFATSADVVTLTFTADCQLGEFRLGRRKTLDKDEPDRDFVAHYRFLDEASQKAIKAAWAPAPILGAELSAVVASPRPGTIEGFPVPVQVAQSPAGEATPSGGGLIPKPGDPSAKLMDEAGGVGGALAPAEGAESAEGAAPLLKGLGIEIPLKEVANSKDKLSKLLAPQENLGKVLAKPGAVALLLESPAFTDWSRDSEIHVERLLDVLDDEEVPEANREKIRKWLFAVGGVVAGGRDGYRPSTGVLVSRFSPATVSSGTGGSGGGGGSSDCQNCVGLAKSLTALFPSVQE